MSTDAEMLAEVPLFAQLSESERALLAERIDVITVEAGITMFHHGDPGGTLYVIRSGEVELFFKNDTGEHITLETVGAGQFFGDMTSGATDRRRRKERSDVRSPPRHRRAPKLCRTRARNVGALASLCVICR